jgi:pyruvate dehydrogenase E1 component alpha subunit
MLLESWADRAELDQRHAAIRKEVDDAVAWADASPFPDPATLLDDVYETQ